MEWKDYRLKYLDFTNALAQSEIIAGLSAVLLKNYPHDLPVDIRTPIQEQLMRVSEIIRQVVNDPERKSVTIDDLPDLFVPTFNLILSSTVANRELAEIDFKSIIYAQELVMIFAHLEAFLGDTLRSVLLMKPGLLKASDKEISWDQIMKLGNWKRLIAHLEDSYVHNFGWLTVREKIKFFSKIFGFDLELTEEEVLEIVNGELLRHLFIHNGGRVNANYLKHSNDENLVLGQQIKVNAEKNLLIKEATAKFASKVYHNVSNTFFDKKPDMLPVTSRC